MPLVVSSASRFFTSGVSSLYVMPNHRADVGSISADALLLDISSPKYAGIKNSALRSSACLRKNVSKPSLKLLQKRGRKGKQIHRDRFISCK